MRSGWQATDALDSSGRPSATAAVSQSRMLRLAEPARPLSQNSAVLSM